MNNNQSYILGDDSLKYFQEYIAEHNIRRIFLVRGKNSFQSCGAQKWIHHISESNELEVISFTDFQNNPRISDVMAGLKCLKNARVDLILAVGGGSVLDMAKLIRFYYYEDTKILNLLIAVPTTAGTGAEATHFSVCYIDGVKHSIANQFIRPDVALIYPVFTYKNSKYLTACTGFDALSQAIESYWSVKATPESEKFSLNAISLIWDNLPKLLNGGLQNVQLRNAIAEGAYYSGRAIDITTTTAPHAFSYYFTSHYDYPHGHAVSLTFPFFFGYNLNIEAELNSNLDKNEFLKKRKILLSLLGINKIEEENLCKIMHDYISSLGLNSFLNSDVNIKAIVEDFNIQRAENNPVIINGDVKKKLFLFLSNLTNNITN